MNRDTVIYCTCTFLLGLVIGSFVIGPHLRPKAAPAAESAAADPPASQAAPPDMNAMNTVREQLAKLKEQVARDPNDTAALAQLGDMYMDAAKYPEAIRYFERALAIREDSNVRTDLGICYKQNGQLDKSLAAFQRAGAESPDQWQPLYNETIVLGEMKRFDEARAIAAKLKKMRPDDPEVQRLDQSLASSGGQPPSTVR